MVEQIIEAHIVHRGADATNWNSPDEAFDAWREACGAYPHWAFRLRAGANVGQYRIEAFKRGEHSTGWLRADTPKTED